MSVCVACGEDRATSRLLESYTTDLVGISVCIKNAVIAHTCEVCGFEGIEIPDQSGLEATLAGARITVPVMLSSAEIRFLRKTCGLNSTDFAAVLDVDKATLSRWENAKSTEGNHGTVSDKTIRDAVWGLLYQRAPAITIAPGAFRAMALVPCCPVTITLERVRLKDSASGLKSDEWDCAA